MEAKERVIAKSIDLFTKSGIRLVTMDQIASAVGMSKRTIYELFKDKDKLLFQCIETMNKQHEAELYEIISRSDNAIEALYLIGQHGENKKANINWLFFDDLEKLYPGLQHLIIREKRPGNKSISYTLIKRGIDEGIFRIGLNLTIVDTFIHEMMKIVHNPDVFQGNSNPRELIDNIVVPYFRGIATTKGMELIEKHFPYQNL
jgi:TetR/AcrR family transcriptional regulator, cholesterol catabolism regulator